MERPKSVIEARDPEVLQTMLDFYAAPGASVLDVTANSRKMWKGVNWSGVRTYMDLDPKVTPDVVGDFRKIPFPDASVDVLVFDPPHLPLAAASPASSEQYKRDYGLERSTTGDNIATIFPAFLAEALRVLRRDGLIFAKLKDFVHNHSYQWMLVEWVSAVRATDGLTPCDLIVKRDPCGGNLTSSLWQTCHHVRNVHCWWSVVRKGKCERARS